MNNKREGKRSEEKRTQSLTKGGRKQSKRDLRKKTAGGRKGEELAEGATGGGN